MKAKWFVLIALSLLAQFTASNLQAQSTAFTYQGRLNANANAANGSYDFQFILFNGSQFGFPIGPILTNSAVAVNNGLFTTTLDFGTGIFTGTNFWLEIGVRTTGNGSFTQLTPRQPVLPTPYAVFAQAASNLVGTLSATQIAGSLSLAQLPNGVITNGFALAGDVTGTPATTVVGTVGGSTATNIHTAEVLANGATSINSSNSANTLVKRDANGSFIAPVALALPNLRSEASQNTTNYLSANVIGGSLSNTVAPGVSGSVIAGGGATGGFPQQVKSSYSTIGGGYSNTIMPGGPESVIAGGTDNTTSGGWVTIGGGALNTGSGQYGTIAGGYNNNASGSYSTVPGGGFNTASATGSFAAGLHAKATNSGSFVWADSTSGDVSSTAADQMTIRASGGVILNTASGGLTVNTTGSATLNASTGVTLASNAATGASVPVGTLYRDNTVVAWGRVSGNVLTDKFNVASVVRNSAGNYTVTMNTSFNGTQFVPVVSVAYTGIQPTTAAANRIASTGQLLSATSFSVFINSGTFAAADADFTFMVTGR